MKTTPSLVLAGWLLAMLPVLAISVSAAAAAQNVESNRPCAVLLHGLARTSSSMAAAAEFFSANGYHVVNVDYPSRKAPIETLAEIALSKAVAGCGEYAQRGVYILTHSLGGILVRYYLKSKTIEGLRRVVMLAPPNQGSEVVDRFGWLPGFTLLNGPAGQQLGTGNRGLPRKLGRVEFELGVIAGTRTINFILSQVLPNPDDGKVSVESARVEGMCAFMTWPVSHPVIMKNRLVLKQALYFFINGKFSVETAEQFDCARH